MTLRTNLAPRALTAAFIACGIASITFSVTMFDEAACAQSGTPSNATAPAAKPTTFQATITAEETLVRAAPNTESGYPFGTLSKGQTVTVVESQPGWVRVRTEGREFEGWGGFVPALPSVKLSADGKSITINGTAPINAPNGMADFNPDRSWKAIGFLTTGDTMPVLDVVKGERDTFYAVSLCSKTSGWIADTAIARGDNAPKAEVVKTEPAKTEAAKTEAAKTEGTTTATATGTETTAPTTAQTTAQTTGNADTTAGAGENGTAQETAPADKPANASGKKKNNAETTKTAAKPAEPAKPSPIKIAREKLEQLDKRWQSLDKGTCSIADLQELQTGFSTIAQDETALGTTRNNARVRSVQITQIIELREMKANADKIAARGEDKAREIADLEVWLRARQQYTAVGILNASVVYDGDRLPRLYRLQDPTSGLTTAYLMEDPELKLSSMLGLTVGVKGDTKFDESLRRNIITPSTVAVLQTGKETAISSGTKVEGSSSGSSGDDNSGK